MAHMEYQTVSITEYDLEESLIYFEVLYLTIKEKKKVCYYNCIKSLPASVHTILHIFKERNDCISLVSAAIRTCFYFLYQLLWIKPNKSMVPQIEMTINWTKSSSKPIC